jgi:hypothetical protein
MLVIVLRFVCEVSQDVTGRTAKSVADPSPPGDTLVGVGVAVALAGGAKSTSSWLADQWKIRQAARTPFAEFTPHLWMLNQGRLS